MNPRHHAFLAFLAELCHEVLHAHLKCNIRLLDNPSPRQRHARHRHLCFFHNVRLQRKSEFILQTEMKVSDV